MHKESLERLEQRRLKSLAADYRKKGYRVIIHPRHDDLPSFFGGYQPDLLASKKGDSIAVEIKSRATLKSAGWLKDIANEISSKPGWRLELVVTNPAKQVRDMRDTNAQTADVLVLKQRLEEAKGLLEKGLLEAALLVGWSAAEGALRRLAVAENVSFENAAALLKGLYSRGLLEPAKYEQLNHFSKLRSSVGHGLSSEHIDQRTLGQFLLLVSELPELA